MANKLSQFSDEVPSLDSYWRSIILFGRNVASYKFALAKSLLEIVPTGKTEITLQELAIPYTKNLCAHLKNSPKQATSNSSKFLEACKDFNDGKVSYDNLIDITVKKGFNNVIDAFHVVNDGDIPVDFYKKDYSSSSKKIILLDDIYKLQEIKYANDLMNEAEARWNLVETAWELNISRNLLNIHYDDKKAILFVDDKFRRKSITSARDALNGYQKGKCFYCFDDITVDGTSELQCDVDHFFPYLLQPLCPDISLNGIWNLVLACTNCNRGTEGKFAKIPKIKYLVRLHRRNEFLISSHHPLRETLMNQTGETEVERVKFLREVDKRAINALIHRWEFDLHDVPNY